jgi:hypothetical protein
MKTYYGRFKHGRTWSKTWHRIPAQSKNEAIGKFIKDTKYTVAEIQIVSKEPKG